MSKFRFLFWPLVILLISLPTVTPLLRSGIFQMHDDISVMRLYQMDKCFQDGQIPCRWVPDMGFGYGYPQFHYYGPLPYYVQYLFHFLGLDLYSAVKLGFGLALILGNLAMFYLGRRFFGPWGGLLSAVAYAYAPYRASDLYSRGAMGETWAFVFLPLILLTLTNFIVASTRRNLALFALSLAGLLATHNISTLIFTPLAAVWGLVIIFTQVSSPKLPVSKIIVDLLFGGLWAVALAGFFFLPVVFEAGLAHTESLLSGYFNYLAHFVSLKQLFFSTFWGYGSSEIGFTDDLSFFFGPLHLLLGLTALVLALKKRDRLSPIIITSLFLFFISAFFTHEKSTFIWKALPFLAYLQFPWRFLVPANLFLSFITGYIVIDLSKNVSQLVTIVFIPIFLLFNLAFFRPDVWFDQTYLEKFSGLNWEKQQTVSIFDYLPREAKFPPGAPAPLYPETISGGPVSVLDLRRHSNGLTFTTRSSTLSRLQLPLFAWPTWRVTIDGRPVATTATSDLSLVTIDLPAGEHQIVAKLTNTPVRTLGNLLTLVSLAATIYILTRKHES